MYLFIFGYAGSSLLHVLFSSCGEGALLQLRCTGFSLKWLFCFGAWTRGHMGCSGCGLCALEHRLSSWGSCALEHRLSSWGSWAQVLYSMWNLPRPRMEPISLALAGRFFTTEPPGKPLFSLYYFIFNYTIRCLLILQLSNSGDIIKT